MDNKTVKIKMKIDKDNIVETDSEAIVPIINESNKVLSRIKLRKENGKYILD